MNLTQQEIQTRISILKNVSIFSHIPEEFLSNIASMFNVVDLKAGEIVFKKNDPGESMFVIITGQVMVHDENHVFVILEKNQSFGEFALIDSKSRSATATVTSDSVLLKLERSVFNSIYESHSGFSMGILKSIINRIREKDIIEKQLKNSNSVLVFENSELEKKNIAVIKAVSLFSQIPIEYVAQIASLFEYEKYKAGEIIFSKGDPGDSMYIISSGKVKIHDGSHVFITLDSEQSFGEFALIDSKVRTASATTVEDSELLKLDKAKFYSIYENNTEFSMGILQSIVKRFNDKDFLEAQLTQQKKEIEQKNKEIEEKNNDITASIRYAKRIQQAVLHFDKEINTVVSDTFIYFRPKDIVSGDFYWIRLIGRANILVAAAADCTGHGVPGAFMSMLGVTFLNEICNRPDVQHSGQVLDKLRTYIIKSLNQTGKEGEQKDGMDIALIAFRKDTMTLEFAGANNPLWFIRNGILTEYAGDWMPIGIHDRMNVPFTNHSISVQHGDIIYLFSDGFPDQFGGVKGKKYMYKRFKEFILSIHEKPMDEQRTLIEDEATNWRGEHEQIDDQIIMGIKI